MITKYLDYIKLLENNFDIKLHPKAIENDNLFIIPNTKDDNYNCVGYSLEINEFVSHHIGRYWIDSIERSGSINNLIKVFEYFGFERSDSSVEEGYKKIVIYGNRGFASHAAIQLDDIWYQSKMGEYEICKHKLEAIEGILYGYPKVWMKKKI